MTHSIWQGDVMEWAASYDGEPFHALLCDPPYHMTNRVVDWAGFNDPEQGGRGRPVLTRNGDKGFMGKVWDGGDIAFRPDTWAALARHLHPGAYGFAFASSRGWHRMACAIEDAGLVIEPTVWGWLYSTGFPKSTRIDTQIARANPPAMRAAPTDDNPYAVEVDSDPLAEAWAGHRYGGQALKPALEPVICFRRPYAGRPVDSITSTGAGALWIDGARIAHNEECRLLPDQHGDKPGGFYRQGGRHGPTLELKPAGRWPSNFALVCCGLDPHDDACPVRRLDEQAGVRKSPAPYIQRTTVKGDVYGLGSLNDKAGKLSTHHGDTGPVSRFYHVAEWSHEVAERLAAADPVRYQAKSSRAERDKGLDGERNSHPTVKSISLCKWLASLLLPPVEYAPRRILIPFAGSGSECIAAHLAGWEFVQGIEAEAEYVEIAEARLAHWTQQRETGQLSLLATGD